MAWQFYYAACKNKTSRSKWCHHAYVRISWWIHAWGYCGFLWLPLEGFNDVSDTWHTGEQGELPEHTMGLNNTSPTANNGEQKEKTYHINQGKIRFSPDDDLALVLYVVYMFWSRCTYMDNIMFSPLLFLGLIPSLFVPLSWFMPPVSWHNKQQRLPTDLGITHCYKKEIGLFLQTSKYYCLNDSVRDLHQRCPATSF